MLHLRWYVGKALNLFGFTSPIRVCEYTAGICKAHVSVRQRELFTIVSVNGLDVYFHSGLHLFLPRRGTEVSCETDPQGTAALGPHVKRAESHFKT